MIIGDPVRDKTDALLHAMGDFIQGLGGRYITAEDSGTSVADMLKIGEKTHFVSGVDKVSAHGGDPSPSTAHGVFVSLREAVYHKLGRTDLKGVKVAVQGLGNVGYRLAEQLRDAGAELFVTDIIQANVDRAVRELNATAVKGDKIFSLDVDVFAPCALGAAINDQTLLSSRHLLLLARPIISSPLWSMAISCISAASFTHLTMWLMQGELLMFTASEKCSKKTTM